jgi:hypothetical protein
MALPDSTETPRTPEQLLRWPKPTDEDYALFGKIAHIYSAFDFILRYMAETMDKHGMLKEPWAGKTQKLTMADVAAAIQLSPIWTGSIKSALEQIETCRRFRNLVSHFVVRRFPEEDAYVFMTKSAIDYRRVYGELPEGIDAVLFGVLDAEQLRGMVPKLEGLWKWAAQVLSDAISPRSEPSGRGER